MQLLWTDDKNGIKGKNIVIVFSFSTWKFKIFSITCMCNPLGHTWGEGGPDC